MNKNSVTGLLIIGAILVGFSVFSSRQSQQNSAAQRRSDSAEYAQAAARAIVQKDIERQITAAAMQDTTAEQFFTIQNDLLALTISSKGGGICGAAVKNYATHSGEPLVLMQGGGGDVSFNFYTSNSRNFETRALAFAPHDSAQGNGEARLALRHWFGEGGYVEYVYTLQQGSYMAGFEVNTEGLDNVTNVDLQWLNDARRQEKSFSNENNYTTIAYRYPNEDGIEELGISTANEQEDIKTRVRWIAFKQQFFSSILTARGEAFLGAHLAYSTAREYDPNGLIKQYAARIQMPCLPHKDQRFDLAFYFGPNKYSILKGYGEKFERLVPLGGWIIGWLNRLLVIPIFDVLEKHIASYGLIILILTIIIKLLLFPLTFKSYLSSAKMRILKPDVDRINKKYPSKNDAVKKQQEIMALYKKTGVSPMGGCLPILVQFPILIAMFRFFPASIELRQQSFLWATDLSAYDSIVDLPFAIPFYGDHISLFTLLMAAALYVSSRMSMAQTPDTGMPGMKFMTLYLMPLMLLLWFNSYSAGLSYYYFLSNLITIGQNLITRRLVDESKLHAKLKENTKKPIKKSRFQTKLEQMARQSQQQMQNRRKR